jgi:hypothetical protein
MGFIHLFIQEVDIFLVLITYVLIPLFIALIKIFYDDGDDDDVNGVREEVEEVFQQNQY